MIRQLNECDIPTWLKLAEEVEPLFGPMAGSIEFQEGIKACIHNNEAFGLEHQNGDLAGIIAINRQENEIIWLAVAKKYRENHYGNELVKKAIKELEINGDIFVQTFAAEIPEGKSARVIYEKSGFEDFKNAGKNPAGIETVVMIRRKQ
ncbi:MAG: GNAT family N-acetyltransferase [Bacteroidia bacterium]|nr:GNAT family N-acetyltransferase [Bacteroidia bacterium]